MNYGGNWTNGSQQNAWLRGQMLREQPKDWKTRARDYFWEQSATWPTKLLIGGVLLLAPSLIIFWQGLREFSAGTHPVYGWCIVLLSLGAIYSIGSIGAALARRFKAKETTGPTPKPPPEAQSFREMEMWGIRWRWIYSSSASVDKLEPFCLDCDYPLVLTEERVKLDELRGRLDFRFDCQECGRTWAPQKSEDSPFQSWNRARTYLIERIQIHIRKMQDDRAEFYGDKLPVVRLEPQRPLDSDAKSNESEKEEMSKARGIGVSGHVD